MLGRRPGSLLDRREVGPEVGRSFDTQQPLGKGQSRTHGLKCAPGDRMAVRAGVRRVTSELQHGACFGKDHFCSVGCPIRVTEVRKGLTSSKKHTVLKFADFLSVTGI